jgi:ATP-dependent DNA helicase RecG
VEFKEKIPQKLKELNEEICAFANAAGGFVLLGVDNKNGIVGIEIDNTKRSAVQNAIRDISPVLFTLMYPVEVEWKTVWVIEIPEGKNKPYFEK